MLAIAIVATILAFIQNLVMFLFGMKEMAIAAFPLGFTWIFLLEIAAIWVAFFFVRRIARRNRELVMAGCAILILGAAEAALPASFFTKLIQHVGKEVVLQNIRQAGTSIEPLSSDEGGIRFALTYTLKFPRTGHYLTYPAFLGPEENNIPGNYFTKVHPEYHDEQYVFDAGKPYSFTVVFDTRGKPIDLSKAKANICICDGKDYFMVCRNIQIGLDGLPAALTTPAPPGRLEPAVPADNIRDMTEKSIRLSGLVVPKTNKSGEPIAISYEITNTGEKGVPIAGDNLGNVIAVNFAWEAVSDGAKQTKVIPGTWHYGNAVTAGTASLGFIRKSSLAPGEKVAMHSEVKPLEPLAPGEYELHVYLFSEYATYRDKPEQELVQAFTVEP